MGKAYVPSKKTKQTNKHRTQWVLNVCFINARAITSRLFRKVIKLVKVELSFVKVYYFVTKQILEELNIHILRVSIGLIVGRKTAEKLGLFPEKPSPHRNSISFPLSVLLKFVSFPYFKRRNGITKSSVKQYCY